MNNKENDQGTDPNVPAGDDNPTNEPIQANTALNIPSGYPDDAVNVDTGNATPEEEEPEVPSIEEEELAKLEEMADAIEPAITAPEAEGEEQGGQREYTLDEKVNWLIRQQLQQQEQATYQPPPAQADENVGDPYAADWNEEPTAPPNQPPPNQPTVDPNIMEYLQRLEQKLESVETGVTETKNKIQLSEQERQRQEEINALKVDYPTVDDKTLDRVAKLGKKGDVPGALKLLRGRTQAADIQTARNNERAHNRSLAGQPTPNTSAEGAASEYDSAVSEYNNIMSEKDADVRQERLIEYNHKRGEVGLQVQRDAVAGRLSTTQSTVINE